MNELVHDLTSALEESELNIDIDVEAEDGFIVNGKIKKLIGLQQLNKYNTTKKVSRSRSSAYNDIFKKQIKFPDLNCSGSETESPFVLPTIKKHRRKKARRMETESIDNIYKKKKLLKEKNLKAMELEITTNYVNGSVKEFKSKAEEESEISASDESNDDLNGQDGDDEMTDYHHEAGDGSVSGIPSINVWKEDTFMEDLKLKSVLHESVSNMLDSRRKGFHTRINKLPGMAARSIRKGRRRFKYKKHFGHECSKHSDSVRQLVLTFAIVLQLT